MRLYTCCGVGQEYVGTLKEYEQHFKSEGFSLVNAKSKRKRGLHSIDLLLKNEDGIYQDVSLYSIKRLPVKWN